MTKITEPFTSGSASLCRPREEYCCKLPTLCSPPTYLFLAPLFTQGMGRAAVSCEGSCKCKRFELDAHRVAKVCRRVCIAFGLWFGSWGTHTIHPGLYDIAKVFCCYCCYQDCYCIAGFGASPGPFLAVHGAGAGARLPHQGMGERGQASEGDGGAGAGAVVRLPHQAEDGTAVAQRRGQTWPRPS